VTAISRKKIDQVERTRIHGLKMTNPINYITKNIIQMEPIKSPESMKNIVCNRHKLNKGGQRKENPHMTYSKPLRKT